MDFLTKILSIVDHVDNNLIANVSKLSLHFKYHSSNSKKSGLLKVI